MSSLRVLVTGGGRGIGRAVALRFARAGAKVVVAARTSSELDAVVAEIGAAGGEGLAAQVNVSDYGSIEAAVFRALQFTGGALDVLVNCAGVGESVAFDKLDAATWNRHLEVNLSGPCLVTLEALEGLEESERGHVFNLCATAARTPAPGSTALAASKAGLQGFGRALAIDLGTSGIRVATVFPPAGPAKERERVGTAVAEAIWNAYQAGQSGDIDVSG
jgi:NAD(P)-dependent dehydrogenase (short-subunit alcohol dehydrogenase family)